MNAEDQKLELDRPPLRNLRAKFAGHYLLANVGWLSLGQLFRLIVAFVVGLWVARYLGPANFGLYNYALALVALFLPVAGLGLDKIFIRDLSLDPDDNDRIVGSVLLLRTLAASGLMVFPVAAVLVLRPGVEPLLWLVLINAMGMLLQVKEVLSQWFQAKAKAKYIAISEGISITVFAIINITLILTGASVIAFMLALLVQQAVFAMGLIRAYQLAGNMLGRLRVSGKMMKDMLRQSYPLIFSAIAIVIYMRIDQIMIGQIKGDREVGLYASAVRIAEIWFYIPIVLNNLVLPRLVDAHKAGGTLFTEKLQRLYNLMALMGYAVAIPITFFAGPIVNLLFGSDYAPAAPMLAVLIWAGLFVNLGLARTSYLTIENLLKYLPITVFAAMAINVALNLLLIPRYGGTGAAVATVISYWIAAHGMCFLIAPLAETGRMMTRALVWPRI